ncbi:MAG: hypothetical protein HEQ32_07950 [Vampirovibrio sp.]
MLNTGLISPMSYAPAASVTSAPATPPASLPAQTASLNQRQGMKVANPEEWDSAIRYIIERQGLNQDENDLSRKLGRWTDYYAAFLQTAGSHEESDNFVLTMLPHDQKTVILEVTDQNRPDTLKKNGFRMETPLSLEMKTIEQIKNNHQSMQDVFNVTGMPHPASDGDLRGLKENIAYFVKQSSLGRI